MEKQIPTTKICHKCKEEINYNAKKCPKCQSDLRSWFAKHKIITGILVIFILGGISSAMNETSNNTSPSSSDSKTVDIDKKFNYKARACAKNYVKTKLNSDNNPKFPGSYGTAKYLGGMNFQVDSYVNVKNGFGVYVKNDYSCVVTVGTEEGNYFDCSVGCQ